MWIARAIVIGALAWPALLGAALWDRVEHPAPERSAWATVVYVAASFVCHQQPDRSFHTKGEKWPVCARCTGLYLAAPLGMAWFLLRRPRSRGRRLPQILLLTAIPTLFTVAWEWGGLGTPANGIRFVTALPLGAAIAWVLLSVTRPQAPAAKAQDSID